MEIKAIYGKVETKMYRGEQATEQGEMWRNRPHSLPC